MEGLEKGIVISDGQLMSVICSLIRSHGPRLARLDQWQASVVLREDLIGPVLRGAARLFFALIDTEHAEKKTVGKKGRL